MEGTWVTVEAFARIHLGFLDLNGAAGRQFGSLGLAVDGFSTRVRFESASQLDISGPCSDRVQRCTRRLCESLGLPARARIVIEQVIPEHVGLGSGTQLELAAGVGMAALHGAPVESRQVAEFLDRGARSGIGIGAFDAGGFLVDGGRTGSGAPPAIVARADFPESWRILMVLDRGRQGIHGAHEVSAFRSLPQFSEENSGRLCRLTLLRALPALLENDCRTFGNAISEIQRAVGDHFAPAQGGRFASPAVASVLEWLDAQGVTGLGQSSWGPTGFAIVESQDAAARLLSAARERWCADEDGLEFLVCAGRNRGAQIVRAGDRAVGARSGARVYEEQR